MCIRDRWNATKENYYKSIWRAGGIALTLNYPKDNNSISEVAEIIDALLLVGGPAIPMIDIMESILSYLIQMLC